MDSRVVVRSVGCLTNRIEELNRQDAKERRENAEKRTKNETNLAISLSLTLLPLSVNLASWRFNSSIRIRALTTLESIKSHVKVEGRRMVEVERGDDLGRFREYLCLVARLEVSPGLRGRVQPLGRRPGDLARCPSLTPSRSDRGPDRRLAQGHLAPQPGRRGEASCGGQAGRGAASVVARPGRSGDRPGKRPVLAQPSGDPRRGVARPGQGPGDLARRATPGGRDASPPGPAAGRDRRGPRDDQGGRRRPAPPRARRPSEASSPTRRTSDHGRRLDRTVRPGPTARRRPRRLPRGGRGRASARPSQVAGEPSRMGRRAGVVLRQSRPCGPDSPPRSGPMPRPT